MKNAPCMYALVLNLNFELYISLITLIQMGFWGFGVVCSRPTYFIKILPKNTSYNLGSRFKLRVITYMGCTRMQGFPSACLES